MSVAVIEPPVPPMPMTQTGPAFWAGGDALVCVGVAAEVPGVRTFTFRAASGALFDYRPGQYVTLGVPVAEGSTLWRSFTIASAPGAGGAATLALTIKAQPGARATGWLHQSLRPGMSLAARGPFGDFHLGEAGAAVVAHPLVLISAGSGATPMASMVRWLAARESRRPVHYFHLARTEGDLLFHAEMTALAASRPHWQLSWTTSESDGRPDAARLAASLPGLGRAEVFCCGPAGFMASAAAAFRAAGGDAALWREEGFGGDPVLPERTVPAEPAPAAGGIAVRIEPLGREITVSTGETLLEAALRQGVPIPSSCRKGQCSTCRVRKLSGEVDMQDDGGLFEDEIEAGDILACCSRPLTPLTIKIG